ncbi:type VI secretion system Vgr family protein, partial [Serratia microhaemolytica]|uniref:type VI secretion system Vgr family protein n=1 Tax=Serratia microhaemolytica TaxID=2675110 RepID=UPI001F0C625E
RAPFCHKPLADGDEVATVVGPPGEEIFVNEHGEIKVHFHWNRYDKPDDRASCWVRVAQAWNGNGYGFIAIPRIGQEVIISYLNGDIDRPIVTGCTYNALNDPPLNLPEEKTRTTLRTQTHKGKGFNELRFEDAKGLEEVYLHAQKDMNLEVLHNRSTHIGHDEALLVTHDRKVTVEGNQDHKTTGNVVTLIGGALHLQVKGDRVEKIEGVTTLKASDEIVIDSDSKITFRSGSSSITLHAGGVNINAPVVTINSGGNPGAVRYPDAPSVLEGISNPYSQSRNGNILQHQPPEIAPPALTKVFYTQEAQKQAAPQMSHQVKLLALNNNNVVLKDIPWQFIFADQAKNQQGKTDMAGETWRIVSPHAEPVSVLVGKLAASYQRRGGHFGSLKNTASRMIHLETASGTPTKAVPYCGGYDYITVVGARTAPNDYSLRGLFGLREESLGNQYRFINAGLRQLREFPASSQGDQAQQRIMVVFQHGYTEQDIGRINQYTKKLNARIVYVKNKQALIAFLNLRQQKQRLIKKLVFFSHGVINKTSFHYASEGRLEEGEFTLADIAAVEEAIFDHDAEVINYACRNGISVDGSDLTGQSAGQQHSPAQKMADQWDVKVHAFEMRSNYALAYGTDAEIKLAQGYNSVIKNYEMALKAYDIALASGQHGIRPPAKPDNYEENVRRYHDLKAREKNKDTGQGGPIAPNGAWHLPQTGDSPQGLKTGLQLYQPLEWQV